MIKYFKNIPQIFICYYVLLVFYSACLFAFYPAILSPDSCAFFHQSLTGNFRIHSSPIISFIWNILNKISPSPFPMLIFEQSMLWMAVFIFMNSWYKKHGFTKEIIVFMIIPLLPSILKVSGIIWKDVNLAFSYILAAAILSRYTILKNSVPNLLVKFLVPVVLFYGTAAKFQAMYILPVFLLWYLMVCFKFSKMKNIILAILLAIVYANLIMQFNGYIAKDKSQVSRTGWQLISYYDLFFVSKNSGEIFLPQYVNDSNFDFNNATKNYSSRTVVHLFESGSNPPIGYTNDPIQQQQIIDTWLTMIKTHPLHYLIGRYVMLEGMLTATIHTYHVPLKGCDLLNGTTYKEQNENFIYGIISGYTKLFSRISSFIFCLPFLIFYLFSAIRIYLKTFNANALVTIFLNVTALIFITVMFFLSVSIDYRFLYICHVLFHFSHPFAWRSISEYYQYNQQSKNK